MAIPSAVERIVANGFGGMYRAAEKALHELLALPPGAPGSAERSEREAAMGLFIDIKMFTSPRGVARIKAEARRLGRGLTPEEAARLMMRYG
jgi:hypothetical protein